MKDSLSGRFNNLFSRQPKQKFFYAFYFKFFPVKKNRILFESFHGKDLSDSPRAMLDALIDSGKSGDYQIYFSSNNIKEDRKKLQNGTKIRLVDVSSFRYTRILATAHYLVNNSSFPVYFIKKENQRYIQTWHGTPLKTLGKKIRHGIEAMYSIQHNFLQADVLLFPNEFTEEALMRDYNLKQLFTGKTIINGYPRNSVFCVPELAYKIREQLGNKEFQTFAYMPTWRGESSERVQSEEQSREIKEILDQMDEGLQDNQILYVNFHPIVSGGVKLDSYRHIRPFPENVEKYMFLNSIDALITDYSSVMFDFSVTGKPVLLFLYDLERYNSDRGMYLDIRTLPFVKLYDTSSLMKVLREGTWKKADYVDDAEYKKKFIPYDSADAADQLLGFLLENTDSGLKMNDYCQNKEKEWSVFWPQGCNSTARLEKALKTVDRNHEITVFESRRFTPEMSGYLYDHDEDGLVYLFMVNIFPKTILELCLRFLPSVKKSLHQRKIRQCFPGLKVKEAFRTKMEETEAVIQETGK